jgi:nucleotide-binding universal stress UspA family protein
MYQKIMVPLDGSELAECVFAHMDSLARGCLTKEIILVQAVEPFQYPGYAGELTITPEDIRRINAQNRAAAETYLKKLMDRFKYENVKIRWEILSGKPAEILADYVNKNQVDLVLMATHGRSGVSRWVWGSVADRLLRSACVPVLMVRAPGCFPGI